MSTTYIPQPIQSPRPQVTVSPMIAILLVILLVITFFLGFFSLCFCRCLMESIINSLIYNRQNPHTTTLVNPGATVDEPPGLAPLIIESFPAFQYSTVRDRRSEKYGLECAICLCEFEGGDLVRLLTDCCHVFHQECVDLWLKSHKSCPVCRRSLDASGKSPNKERTPAAAVVSRRSNVNMQEVLADGRRDHESRRTPNRPNLMVDDGSHTIINVMKDEDHHETAAASSSSSSSSSLAAAATRSCLDNVSGGENKTLENLQGRIQQGIH